MKRMVIILLYMLFWSNSCFGFGKNKVQYQTLHWDAFKTPHFELYFHQNQGDLPAISFLWLEEIYDDLSSRFQFAHQEPIPVILYGSPNLFEQTNIITEIIPEGVGGFTELFQNRVALPFNGSYKEFRHVLHHEMIHAFVFGFFGEGGAFFRNAVTQVPLWLHEGLAEFLSSGWNSEADMFMIDRTINSTIPLPGPQMGGYMAYKGGQSFLYFLYCSRGAALFNQFLLTFKETRSVENSLEKIYEKDLRELGEQWRNELKRLYWPEIGIRTPPELIGLKVTDKISEKSRFNLRPRLSPDGELIAFYTDLRDYTQIVITDRDGKIMHRINHRAYDTGVESFYPFRSGLSWSPDGSKIAFVTKKQGADEIRIVNIQDKKLYKVINLPFSFVSSPDWSPDGNYLVFSAIEKDRQNLYLYNFQTDSTTALTSTITAEFTPRFSPDNRRVIYSVQDTCGTIPLPVNTHNLPAHNLAYINLAEMTSHKLTNNPWNEKEPSFSPDGASIVFVSDRNGIDNLYTGPFSSPDEALPLTDFIGSSSSPDWCKKGSTVVFEHFQNQSWNIWSIDNPEDKQLSDTLEQTMWKKAMLDSSVHFFRKPPTHAPIDSSEADVESETDNNQSPTPKEISEDQQSIPWSPTGETPHSTPYRLKFSPDLISFGLGINTYYGIAGQWFLTFSDLMGDHRVAVAGDIQGRFDEYMHLYFSYSYLRRRLNITAGTYYSKDYSYESIFNKIYHDTDFGAFIHMNYPFSKFSRTDLHLFARRIEREAYKSEAEKITSHTILPSVHYVYDDILWGITGPLTGRRTRTRLSVSPPLEFINNPFISFDSDVRSYIHINKQFVWANRLAVGASLPLGDEPAARRFFLGGNDNWFNYRINLENYRENLTNTFYSEFMAPLRGWNYIDITGERALLFNTEFRFPFIREFSIAWPLPLRIRYINGALFADAGNAWDREEQKAFWPLPPKIYGGVGMGMRANLGMFVLRYDRGWPTDWKKITGPAVNYFSLGAEF